MKKILQYHQVKSQEQLTGCEYYRQIIPHAALREKYGYEVQATNTIKGLSDEKLASYDFVHLIRRDFNHHVERCKLLGVKTVFDLDDYWELYPQHGLKKVWKDSEYVKNCIESLVRADFVTCSTELLAEQIRKYRDDVIVIPNCILPSEPQFEQIKYPSTGKLRIGWIGGTHHGIDIEILKESMAKVWSDPEINDKVEIVIGGYVNGHPIYQRFAYCLTGGGNRKGMENTILLPPATVDSFAYMYDQCHVMLAPLKSNLFNRCKSELKVVEAGWKGKCVIASNLEPYRDFDNVILVDERKNHKDWYKAIKHLALNPNTVRDLQGKLYDEVTRKHNIFDHVCKLHEIYQTTTS